MAPELVIQPLLTGLSVGAFCLTYCFPFAGSYLAAEERPFRKNFFSVLQLLGGRFVGYLCFGLLFGYLGERLDERWLRAATSVSLMVLSVILALYLLGLAHKKFCPAPQFFKTKSPLLLGFFMGMNICPPFLLSLAYIFSQQSAVYGMIYFTLFFLSSSIYFLPLVFLGLLPRIREFQLVARLSGFLVAAIFFIYGIYSLAHN
ncbi:MAG: sulfite exporter TauE/SafE family protein [Candidatus Omnitrophota bacterium]